MQRAREVAFEYGLAVVRIQRFWRKSGAIAKAVHEVMALKKMSSNPFRPYGTLHEILLNIKRQYVNYYSVTDPRPGMRLSTLLHRLGCSELLPMFNRKKYIYCADMRALTVEALTKMYKAWQERKEKDKDKGNKKGAKKDAADERQAAIAAKKRAAMGPPVKLFESISAAVRPRLDPRDPEALANIRQVMAMPEYMTPNECADMIKTVFLKKFGKGLQARAASVAKAVVESTWNSYNNFRATCDVLTK
jgi:hypothetical protein